MVILTDSEIGDLLEKMSGRIRSNKVLLDDQKTLLATLFTQYPHLSGQEAARGLKTMIRFEDIEWYLNEFDKHKPKDRQIQVKDLQEVVNNLHSLGWLDQVKFYTKKYSSQQTN
jgi:hypothetical protein